MSEPEVTCSMCGRTLHAGEPLWEWSRDTVAGGRQTWACVTCTRENVRGIEAKLDQQWW